MTAYPARSTDTNDIENTNQAQYRSDRQEILTAWQKDTSIKMPDNRQVLDNLEALDTVHHDYTHADIPPKLPEDMAKLEYIYQHF